MYRKEDRRREILEKGIPTVTGDNIRDRDTVVVYRKKKRSLERQDETGTNRKTERGRRTGTVPKEADRKKMGTEPHTMTSISRERQAIRNKETP
jgi:hypothetical protein